MSNLENTFTKIESQFYQAFIILGENISEDELKKSIPSSLNMDTTLFEFKYIYPEKTASISIDQIRNIINESFKKDLMHKVRVFVFANMQDVGSVGQNAFLKILEEPPQDVIFVLITDEVTHILPTLLSRCKVVKVHQAASTPNTDDEAFLLSKISKDSKNTTGNLVVEDEILRTDMIELQCLTKKLSEGVDENKLSKLWLFRKWISN